MLFNRQRASLEPIALLVLRIVVGVIMVVHGWQKVSDIQTWQGHVASMGLPFPMVSAYLGAAGEFLGGLGLIFGFLTPIAAFGVFCTMAVAVFWVHWPNGLLAKNNGFEYPLTLMTVALYLMMRGSGPLGIDPFIEKKCKTCQKEDTSKT